MKRAYGSKIQYRLCIHAVGFNIRDFLLVVCNDIRGKENILNPLFGSGLTQSLTGPVSAW